MGPLSGSVWRAAIVAGVAMVAVLIAPARADASDESQLLSLTNEIRTSNGLSPLTIDSQLSRVAQRWAGTLAERGVISHNSSLPSQVTGWKLLGENVGVGGTVDAVHAGWVASATHHQNLVDPSFTKVGFGIVRPDARVFVVQVFMQPKSSVGSTTVAPTTAPVAAPRAASVVPPTSAPASPASVDAAPALTVRPVPPASPAPAATVVEPPKSPLAVGQLSAWIVHSLGRLRSTEPAKTS